MSGVDYLQQWVCVELVEEVHDSICPKRGAANDNVSLALRPVHAVGAAQLLTLHPRVRQLLELEKRTKTAINLRCAFSDELLFM